VVQSTAAAATLPAESTAATAESPDAAKVTRDRVGVGMRARQLRGADPAMGAEQRAWLEADASLAYHLVRIVVCLTPAAGEIIRRAKVEFSVSAPDDPPAGSAGGAIIWSLSPKMSAADASSATKVNIGAKLKIVEVSRETSQQSERRQVLVRGSGELQRRAVWELFGGDDDRLIGDQEFVVIVEAPSHRSCVGTLWVAFQLTSAAGTEAYAADIPQDLKRIQL
jgi:hypothetical protein